MKIFSQAPTRIGLIGGGTDVEPFASKYGGKVLSFAINIYHEATLIPRKDKKVYISALGEERSFSLSKKLAYEKDKKFDLIYSVINYFRPKIKTGFDFIDTFGGISTGGLGTSASATTSMIRVFSHWLGIKMSKDELVLLSWKMEVEELGWVSGKQDQLAAVFGGINLLTFGPGEEKFTVEPLNLPRQTTEEIKRRTVMVFTGKKRHSNNLQQKLQQGMSEKEKINALIELKNAVDEAIEALKNKDFKKLGKILDQAWENKKKSNPAVTNKMIDELYSLAMQKGALGGKVMGAGGGGHMFFFCLPGKKKDLIENLKKANVKIVNYDFDFEGLKVRVEK